MLKKDQIDRGSDLTFVRHRHHLDVYSHALASGLSDASYICLVTELDSRIVEASGIGFGPTPLIELNLPLHRRVVGKIETANVSGSHKARHLFGLLLWLRIDEQAGKDRPSELAIASCGNAALGAATIAQAVDRELRVFVPAEADPLVLAELDRLGSTVQVCPRQPGQVGDPCMAELDKAIQSGSEAFTVQGPTSPNVIDGGRTLGLELAEQLVEMQLEARDLYVQVGGGALGAATMDGLIRGGVSVRVHPVQPERAHPYVAMWNRFQDQVRQSDLAAAIADSADGGASGELALRQLLADNADVMQPWSGTPASIASGILDDITYDWQPLLYHQLTSGGWPVLASEDDFVRATQLLRKQVSPAPDPTGAAGLAGLLADPRGDIDGAGPAIVLVTGADRSITLDPASEATDAVAKADGATQADGVVQQ